jgi:signal transduction histidine kinase
VQHLTEQVRQLALDLRPAVLDRYGLLAAVEWYVGRYQATTGITIHLRQQNMAHRRISPEIEIAAFRVVQEALTNIARYAAVAEAWVTLLGNGHLLVIVQDEGRGFDPAKRVESSGLSGMQERVALLGGMFELVTAPGEGVHLTAEFPLDEQAQYVADEERAP